MISTISARNAIARARELLGTPYGSGPGEIDCINLIVKVIRTTTPGGIRGYKTAGTDTLWASAVSAAKYRDLIWRQEGLTGARPGMLAFKGKPTDKIGDGQPHHVGLVAEKNGELTVIHASSANGKVVETPLAGPYGWTLLAIHRYITPEGVGDGLSTAAAGPLPSELGRIGEEVLPMSTEAQYQARVVTDNGPLNLRSGPGRSYNRIASIPRGETVDVIAEYETGWAFVSYRGTSGYVATEYLAGAEGAQSAIDGLDTIDEDLPADAEEPRQTQTRTILRCDNGVTIELMGRWEVCAVLGGND